jgi:hypothetical protein
MAALSRTISICGGCLDRTWLLIGHADLVRAFKSLFDPYHPELHYMRGPGPKWHAKHDQPAAPIGP